MYQERLRTFKQVEADIQAYNKEMYTVFKKQQQQVSHYDAENKKLAEELHSLEQQSLKAAKTV